MTKQNIAQEMIALYNEGYSLAKIASKFNVTRQAVYCMLKRRNYSPRKRKPLPFQMFNGKKYSLRNIGYFGLTHGERRLIHREMWEFYNGKIPDNHDIHHKDFNKHNNVIENLELIAKDEHARRYSSGSNQFVKKPRKGEC
jgi:hypothetical protein